MEGRHIAIGDVHGCAKTLNALLQSKIKITKADKLYFLGDYLSKGPRVKQVIDTIIGLEAKGFQIHKLMGNHESMFLEEARNYERVRSYYGVSLSEVEWLERRSKYGQFFHSLHFYLEVGHYYLVHAGFNFRIEDPFTDFTSMLWTRSFKVNKEKTQGKKVIHGHTPTPLQSIEANALAGTDVICLDGGCFAFDRMHEGYGFLVAMDLDTRDLFVQRNIE